MRRHRWLWVLPILASGLILAYKFWPESKSQTMAAKTPVEQTNTPGDIQASLDARLDSSLPEETLAKAMPILQQKDKLRSELASNPHGTPDAIIQAGEALGEVMEMEKKHPERKAQYLDFYKSCYESEETMTVSRVQCLRRYIRSAQIAPERVADIVADQPIAVQRLFKRFEGR